MKKELNSLSDYIGSQTYEKSSDILRSQMNTEAMIIKLSEGKFDVLIDKEKNNKIASSIKRIEQEFRDFDESSNPEIPQRIDYFITDIYRTLLNSFKDFERIYTDQIVELNKKLKESQGSVREIKNEFDGIKNDLKAVVNDSKNKKSEIDRFLPDAQSRLNVILNELRLEHQTKLGDQLLEISRIFKQNKLEWDGKFEELEDKRKKFEQIYETATTYFSESRFDKYSAEEKTQANIYRRISLTLMILVVVFIGLITWYNLLVDNNAEWYDYLTRSILVFTLMIPAIYTSRESTRHRSNSDRYTQMANELKALKITLDVDDLDPGVKNRVKEEIYKKYFGNIFNNQSPDIGDSMSSLFPKLLTKG